MSSLEDKEGYMAGIGRRRSGIKMAKEEGRRVYW